MLLQAARFRSNSPQRSQQPDVSQSPDVYVARVPGGGMPARVGTRPGSAQCDIYVLQESSDPTVVDAASAEFSALVYNVSKCRPTADDFLPVWRDKYGRWIAAPGGCQKDVPILDTLTCPYINQVPDTVYATLVLTPTGSGGSPVTLLSSEAMTVNYRGGRSWTLDNHRHYPYEDGYVEWCPYGIPQPRFPDDFPPGDPPDGILFPFGRPVQQGLIGGALQCLEMYPTGNPDGVHPPVYKLDAAFGPLNFWWSEVPTGNVYSPGFWETRGHPPGDWNDPINGPSVAVATGLYDPTSILDDPSIFYPSYANLTHRSTPGYPDDYYYEVDSLTSGPFHYTGHGTIQLALLPPQIFTFYEATGNPGPAIPAPWVLDPVLNATYIATLPTSWCGLTAGTYRWDITITE